MSKYVLPDFAIFEPQFINHSIKEIKKSHLHNINYDNKPSQEKFEKALAKISSNISLDKKDLKVLCHDLVSLEKLNKIDAFFSGFVLQIDELRNKGYFIRPFLSYLYNGENKSYKQSIFNILSTFAKINLKYKEKYREILSIIKQSNSSENLEMEIERKFSHIKAQQEIEKLCEGFFIKSTDGLYHRCIVAFIYGNYLDQSLWGFHYSKVTTLNLSFKKQLFKKILLKYEKNFDVETYPEQWFKLIRKELGDPYDPVNQRWRDLEEEKEIFRRWNVSENMDEFFDRIVGGDKRRKKFWRAYVNNIQRIEYFGEAAQALVMEFENHLFVEFARSGNAMYYYNKNILNINEIKTKLRDYSMSNYAKTKYLKQKSIAVDSMSHRGSWEYDFDYKLRSLGYEKSRWAKWDS